MNAAEEKFVSVMMTTLDEKERRIFLGSFSECLGHGGITELSNLTGISRTTITEGRKNSKEIEADPKARGAANEAGTRVRASGAGRKTTTEKYPGIVDALNRLLDGNVIGNPENPLCWTTKSLRNLSDALAMEGIKVSYPTVGVILEEMGFSLQQNRKCFFVTRQPQRLIRRLPMLYWNSFVRSIKNLGSQSL